LHHYYKNENHEFCNGYIEWFLIVMGHEPMKINGQRLLRTTLLKGDERRHALLRGGDMSYLTDETWRRHVLGV
jgi:hypothetical protein